MEIKIGKRIKKLRELREISPKEMAQALEMTLSGYSRIERDEVGINLDKLEKLSGALKVEPSDLIASDERYIYNNFGDNYTYTQCWGTNYINTEKEREILLRQIELLEEKLKNKDKKND